MADEDLAGGKIGMKIMSVFDQASFGSVIKDMESRFSGEATKIGDLFGKNFGKSAGNGFQKLAVDADKNLKSAQASMETAMDRMVGAQNKQLNSLGDLTVAQKKLSDASIKYGDDSAQYAAALNKVERAQRTLNTATTDTTRAIGAHQAATADLTAASASAEAANAKAASTTAAFGAAANTAGLMITGAFAAGIGVAVDKAAQFQTAQTRLVTSAGETASNLKTVSDGILNMAGSVGETAQALSQGMYVVESAGFHGADGLKVLQSSAQAAKMEGADLGTVAKAVTVELNDYHMGASQAANMTSELVTAIGQGNTNLQDFSGALHSITPIAATMGVSFGDVAGTLAEMTNHGVAADQASQNLADTLRHMQNATGPMRDELQQIGMTSSDLNASLGTKGLAGTMEMLSDKVMARMGPDGKMMLDAFNTSRDAAANLHETLHVLPPDLQALAQQVVAGKASIGDWRAAVKALPDDEAGLASGFTTILNHATGFTNLIKNGSPQAQNYSQAMAKLGGDVAGLNTILMTTGENWKDTKNNINLVSHATADASGNVKGWGDIQTNFNQKMAEAKAGFGALGIEIGNMFLPAATKVADVLAKAAGWMEKHQGLTKTLVIGLGAVATAFVGVKVASAFMTAFSGPVGITIAAVAALTAGAIYAYTHFRWFKTTVDDVGKALKVTGEWIGHTAVQTWHFLAQAGDAVGHAFMNVMHAFGNVGHAIGNVVHAGDNVVHAFMNVERAADKTFRVVAAIVTTLFVMPLKLGFDVVSNAVMTLWHGVIDPGFHAMGDIFTWLNSEIVQPNMHAVGDVFHWVSNDVIHPVVDFVKGQLADMGSAISWLNDKVVQPVIHAIGDVWTWLSNNVIHPLLEAAKTDIHLFGAAFKAVYDDFLKPTGDEIHKVLDGLKTGFDDAVKWIGESWGKVDKIVGTPVWWIVNTVYNNGIVPVWNDVAGVFGLGHIDTVKGDDIPHYASGGIHQGPGVVPGYAPGVDSVNAKLSPGEGVAVPELVRAIGPSNFLALNAHYARGRKGSGSGVPHFSPGGIFGDIGGFVGDVGHGIGQVVHGAVDTAKFVAELAANPAKAVEHLFEKVMDKADGTPGSTSQWLSAVKSIPKKVIDAVIDKAKEWIGLGGGSQAWASGAGAEQWAPQIAQALALEGYPTTPEYIRAVEAQIMTESGGNPNIVQTVHDVNWPNNLARGLMQVTPGTAAGLGLAGLGGNIYDPLTNLRLGLRHVRDAYGGDVLGVLGHGHGYSLGGIVGYADGGINDDDQDPTDPAGVLSGPGTAIPGDLATDQSGIDTATTPTTTAGTTTSPLTTSSALASGQTSIAAGVSPAMDRANATLNAAIGHAYTENGIFDCSGLASQLFQSLIGGNTMTRAFATDSNFGALGFRSGQGGLFSLGVDPKPGDAGHMVGVLNGTPFESASGKGVVTGAAAMNIDNSLFPDHWYLPGSAWNPAFDDSAAGPSIDQKHVDKLNKDAERFTKEAANAKKRADKERQEVQKYLKLAANAEALAAKTSGASKQRHLDAAQHYRQEAQEAQQRADDNTQKAADDAAKAQQAEQDAKTAANEPMHGKKGKHKGKHGKHSKYGNDGSILSVEDFFGGVGHAFGEAVTETTGFDSIEKTINDSKLLQAGKTLFEFGANVASAESGHGYIFNNNSSSDTESDDGSTSTGVVGALASMAKPTTGVPAATPLVQTIPQPGLSPLIQTIPLPAAPKPPVPFKKAKVFDGGGMLEPGDIGINLGRDPEPVLKPREWDDILSSRSGGAHYPNMKGAVVIENQNINRGDEAHYARKTQRDFNAYIGSMPR